VCKCNSSDPRQVQVQALCQLRSLKYVQLAERWRFMNCGFSAAEVHRRQTYGGKHRGEPTAIKWPPSADGSVHIDGLHRTVVGRERKLSDKPSVPPVSFAEALILRSCLIARVQSILSQHQKVGGKVVKSSQLSVTKVGWNSMCFSAARRCYAASVG